MAENGHNSLHVALMSAGLYRIRADIEALTQARTSFYGLGFRPPDVFAGWGLRPSGKRARKSSQRSGCPCWLFEDGFLKGFSSRLPEPPHSYILDRTGIYFDVGQPNDFETALASFCADGADAGWGDEFAALLRSKAVTKFNDWPDHEFEPEAPFVLVVDQVGHDASITGSGAGGHSFDAMIRAAADSAQGRKIMIRTHPAMTGESVLIAAAKAAGIGYLVAPPVNPWTLIEAADEVFTIASQMGLEALMAGKRVHCFGQAFYAGRGLTVDHGQSLTEVTRCSLAQLVTVFYRDYMRYLDIHDRRPCAADDALDQLIAVRDQRRRLPHTVRTFGLSPWKRRAVAPFLTGMKGPPVQHAVRRNGGKGRASEKLIIARWGAPDRGETALSSVFMEDGFIRSSGLGVRLALPASLTLDSQRPHYDLRGPSDIETMLETSTFTAHDLARARKLMAAIVEANVTKYNVGGDATLPGVPNGVLRILVPGQVEADASILLGSPVVRTNKDLVERVRAAYPDAFIVYKPHPDVVAGFRDGGKVPEAQDLTALTGSITDWIGWADRIETMTSLAGFEALLRGKAVGLHGLPIYAGWGLTDDQLTSERRTKKRSLEELVCALLIRYPFMVHPESRLPCSAERLVDVLAQAAKVPLQRTDGLANAAAIWLNRQAIRVRDRKAKKDLGSGP